MLNGVNRIDVVPSIWRLDMTKFSALLARRDFEIQFPVLIDLHWAGVGNIKLEYE